MTRYRLVHVQNDEEHVSSVVLAPGEIADHLHAEAVLHQATGWAVYEEPGSLVVAQRPGVRREVFARAYEALEDNLTTTREGVETVKATKEQADRLEYLRGEIRAERISYGEIAELQDLASVIEPGDVELLQWAGVPEFADEEWSP